MLRALPVKFGRETRPATARRPARGDNEKSQAFSTCPKSSSTGVARPKMSTDTRILLFS